MNPFEVLLEPVLSEKSNDEREVENKYTFKVNRDASKTDVKKAISVIYDVKPTSVRTLIVRGKMKRRGMKVTKLGNFKKAVVTLPEGKTLPLFDNQ